MPPGGRDCPVGRERGVDRRYPLAAGPAGHAGHPARRLCHRTRTHHRRARKAVATRRASAHRRSAARSPPELPHRVDLDLSDGVAVGRRIGHHDRIVAPDVRGSPRPNTDSTDFPRSDHGPGMAYRIRPSAPCRVRNNPARARTPRGRSPLPIVSRPICLLLLPRRHAAAASSDSARTRHPAIRQSLTHLTPRSSLASHKLGAAPGKTARTNLFSHGTKGQVRSRPGIPA